MAGINLHYIPSWEVLREKGLLKRVNNAEVLPLSTWEKYRQRMREVYGIGDIPEIRPDAENRYISFAQYSKLRPIQERMYSDTLSRETIICLGEIGEDLD